MPETLRLWIDHYRESERTGLPVRFEYLHDTPRGIRCVSAIVYCTERLPGGRARCSYVAEDVTDAKRVEASLRNQSERLRLLWDAATVLLSTEETARRMDRLDFGQAICGAVGPDQETTRFRPSRLAW